MRVNSLHLPFSCPPESVTFFPLGYRFIDFMLSVMEDGTRGKCTLNGYKIICLKIYIFKHISSCILECEVPSVLSTCQLYFNSVKHLQAI